MNRIHLFTALLLLTFLLASGSIAEEATSSTNAPAEKPSMMSLMVDPEDGQFDVSAWLATAKGFFPIPIIITEPAVGYGGGLVLMFLHDSIEDRAQQVKERNPDGTPKRLPPPSISGVAAFATENGTWGGALFHMGIWKEDTVRYLGTIAYANVNYDYYGTTDSPLPPGVESVPVEIASPYLLQELTFRMKDSDFFIGGSYRHSTANVDIDVSGTPLPPELFNDTIRQGGASAILEYDTRDNLFTPNHGINPRLEWIHYDEWLGGDNQFELVEWNNRGWIMLRDNLVLGLRLDGEFSGGDIPFYMLPDISMRGIPANRYQGDYTLTAETEIRWDVTRRWSGVGFVGAGWTANNSLSDFKNSDTHPAYGFGFRYLFSSVFQLRAGLDFAFSEDTQAFYITSGNAWGR